jgi:hypothetical protein
MYSIKVIKKAQIIALIKNDAISLSTPIFKSAIAYKTTTPVP